MKGVRGVAVIGCGYWGINYVRLLSSLPESPTVVICDTDPRRLIEVSRMFPAAVATGSVEEALAHPDVQAGIVCTQANTHFDVTRACLRAGKSVLVEKPLTIRASDSRRLCRHADDGGLVLMVGHTFMFNAGVQKMKEYITSGETGQLYYVYSRRTNLGPIRSDVNALWDLASHDVSIFNYLLDATPKWASAVGSSVLSADREDVGFVSLGYPNGVVGHMHVSWADPNKVREVVVVGSDMRVLFNDLFAVEPVRVFKKGVRRDPAAEADFYPFVMQDGDIISPRVTPSEPLRNQLNHFLSCVKEGTAPICGGAEGLAVVQVMEAIERSLRQSGTPVEVEHGEIRDRRLAARPVR